MSGFILKDTVQQAMVVAMDAESASSEIDRRFLSMLHEIERYYRELRHKSYHIRVEKWVEKLAATGGNMCWKRHRNSYTRLLLNMVLNKDFGEPFHRLPRDGPLPAFPVHLKTYSVRGAYGLSDSTHGKAFWRDIYQKVHNSPCGMDIVAPINTNPIRHRHPQILVYNINAPSGGDVNCNNGDGGNDNNSGSHDKGGKGDGNGNENKPWRHDGNGDGHHNNKDDKEKENTYWKNHSSDTNHKEEKDDISNDASPTPRQPFDVTHTAYLPSSKDTIEAMVNTEQLAEIRRLTQEVRQQLRETKHYKEQLVRERQQRALWEGQHVRKLKHHLSTLDVDVSSISSVDEGEGEEEHEGKMCKSDELLSKLLEAVQSKINNDHDDDRGKDGSAPSVASTDSSEVVDTHHSMRNTRGAGMLSPIQEVVVSRTGEADKDEEAGGMTKVDNGDDDNDVYSDMGSSISTDLTGDHSRSSLKKRKKEKKGLRLSTKRRVVKKSKGGKVSGGLSVSSKGSRSSEATLILKSSGGRTSKMSLDSLSLASMDDKSIRSAESVKSHPNGVKSDSSGESATAVRRSSMSSLSLKPPENTLEIDTDVASVASTSSKKCDASLMFVAASKNSNRGVDAMDKTSTVIVEQGPLGTIAAAASTEIHSANAIAVVNPVDASGPVTAMVQSKLDSLDGGRSATTSPLSLHTASTASSIPSRRNSVPSVASVYSHAASISSTITQSTLNTKETRQSQRSKVTIASSTQRSKSAGNSSQKGVKVSTSKKSGTRVGSGKTASSSKSGSTKSKNVVTRRKGSNSKKSSSMSPTRSSSKKSNNASPVLTQSVNYTLKEVCGRGGEDSDSKDSREKSSNVADILLQYQQQISHGAKGQAPSSHPSTRSVSQEASLSEEYLTGQDPTPRSKHSHPAYLQYPLDDHEGADGAREMSQYDHDNESVLGTESVLTLTTLNTLGTVSSVLTDTRRTRDKLSAYNTVPKRENRQEHRATVTVVPVVKMVEKEEEECLAKDTVRAHILEQETRERSTSPGNKESKASMGIPYSDAGMGGSKTSATKTKVTKHKSPTRAKTSRQSTRSPKKTRSSHLGTNTPKRVKGHERPVPHIKTATAPSRDNHNEDQCERRVKDYSVTSSVSTGSDSAMHVELPRGVDNTVENVLNVSVDVGTSTGDDIVPPISRSRIAKAWYVLSKVSRNDGALFSNKDVVSVNDQPGIDNEKVQQAILMSAKKHHVHSNSLLGYTRHKDDALDESAEAFYRDIGKHAINFDHIRERGGEVSTMDFDEIAMEASMDEHLREIGDYYGYDEPFSNAVTSHSTVSPQNTQDFMMRIASKQMVKKPREVMNTRPPVLNRRHTGRPKEASKPSPPSLSGLKTESQKGKLLEAMEKEKVKSEAERSFEWLRRYQRTELEFWEK